MKRLALACVLVAGTAFAAGTEARANDRQVDIFFGADGVSVGAYQKFGVKDTDVRVGTGRTIPYIDILSVFMSPFTSSRSATPATSCGPYSTAPACRPGGGYPQRP